MKVCFALFVAAAVLIPGIQSKRPPPTVKTLRLKTCNPPVWNAATGNNWPLAGVMNNTKPTYELLVKGLDKQGRYKPDKKHKIIVRVHKSKKKDKRLRFTGFYVTLHNGGSAVPSCGLLGKFKYLKKRSFKRASPSKGCSQPLLLDAGKRKLKRGKGKWISPVCGEVILRATVRSANGKLYYDNDDTTDEYQVLTKRLRPSVPDIKLKN